MTDDESRLCARMGRRLRALRKSRRLTQEQVAIRINRTANTVGSIEAGRVMPGLDTLLRFASLFGVEPGSLIGEAEGEALLPDREDLLKDLNLQLHLLSDRQLRLAAHIVAQLENG